MSVGECRRRLAAASLSELPALIEALRADERAGVRAAIAIAQRRVTAATNEESRLERLASLEESLHEQGFTVVAGVDEVGRGALAGPLTAGAVVLGPGVRIEGLDDSKRLKPQQRESIAAQVRTRAIAWHVAHVSAQVVDALGMTAALRRVMTEALAGLKPPPDHVVVDGLPLRLGLPETAVVGGDSKVAAVAAASVLAKVDRDALMRELDSGYPEYGFAINKGYGTPEHMDAITRVGICDVHRRSFSPCGGTLPLF